MTPVTTRVDPLAAARGYLAAHIDQADQADTAAAMLTAATELEHAAHKVRERMAVHLVLEQGWSYAALGRHLGISRQAAQKTYGPLVNEQAHRNIRRNMRRAAR